MSGLWLGVDQRTDIKKAYIFIGLCVQSMLTIIGLIVDMIGEGLVDHLMNSRISTLILNEMFIQASNTMKQMTTDTIWILHVSHCIEKWVEREKYPNNTRLSCSSQRLGWPTIGPSKATYIRQM